MLLLWRVWAIHLSLIVKVCCYCLTLLSYGIRNAQTRQLSHPLPVMRAREIDDWSRSHEYKSLLNRAAAQKLSQWDLISQLVSSKTACSWLCKQTVISYCVIVYLLYIRTYTIGTKYRRQSHGYGSRFMYIHTIYLYTTRHLLCINIASIWMCMSIFR